MPKKHNFEKKLKYLIVFDIMTKRKVHLRILYQALIRRGCLFLTFIFQPWLLQNTPTRLVHFCFIHFIFTPPVHPSLDVSVIYSALHPFTSPFSPNLPVLGLHCILQSFIQLFNPSLHSSVLHSTLLSFNPPFSPSLHPSVLHSTLHSSTPPFRQSLHPSVLNSTHQSFNPPFSPSLQPLPPSFTPPFTSGVSTKDR